jgi:hypothetical protein
MSKPMSDATITDLTGGWEQKEGEYRYWSNPKCPDYTIKESVLTKNFEVWRVRNQDLDTEMLIGEDIPTFALAVISVMKDMSDATMTDLTAGWEDMDKDKRFWFNPKYPDYRIAESLLTKRFNVWCVGYQEIDREISVALDVPTFALAVISVMKDMKKYTNFRD